MNLEDFLRNLTIASSPEEQQSTDNNSSAAYLAYQTILNDKNSLFIIINILENSQIYSDKILFLTQSILKKLIEEMELKEYSFEMLDQISEAFFRFITRFIEMGSFFTRGIITFAQGIITFAKIPEYDSCFIENLELLAFEKLRTPNIQTYEYEFAIYTLSHLVDVYQYKIIDENCKKEYYDKIKEVTTPFFNIDFSNYWLPSKVLTIYQYYDLYSFDTFYKDYSILDALLSILDNAENLTITNSTYIYFRNILKYLKQLISHCQYNSDNRSQRTAILNEFLPKILQVLPKFTLFLQNYQENEPKAKYLAGVSFSIINSHFDMFQELESYDFDFDILLDSIICFSQLNEDDLNDFRDNIFNYYNTAIAIEINSNSNPRSNSIILLRLICDNEDQKYINQTIENIIQMDQTEEIFFLLANIVKLIKDDQTKEIIHQYISTTYESFQEFPLNVQFSFVFLLANSIFLLTDDESDELLQIAASYIEESQTEEIMPVNRFYFTIASEIVDNYVHKYKSLPPEIMMPIIELYGISYSTNTSKLVDSIFTINPQLFESSQNHIIEQSLNIIHEILTSEDNETLLTTNQNQLVTINFDSLIYQAEHLNSNFQCNDIVTAITECAEQDYYIEFLPQISELFEKLIESKSIGYEEAVNLSVTFFNNRDLSNYHSDTVRPLLIFVNELNIEMNLSLFEIAYNNIYSHINSFFPITDDQELIDFAACITLLSRLIQSLASSFPSNLYEDAIKLANDIREERDDIASNFIIFEILASLTFISKGVDMEDAIDDWVDLCSSGVIVKSYYRYLHFVALSFIVEAFPDRAEDIEPILEGLKNDEIECRSHEAENFLDNFKFLYSFAEIKAPFQ